MTKSGFCGIKLLCCLIFSSLMSVKKRWGRSGTREDCMWKRGEKSVHLGEWVFLCSPLWTCCFKSWLFTALICTLLPDFTVLSRSWGACGCRSVGKPGGRAALSPLSQNYQVRSPAHPAHAGKDAPQCQPPENPPRHWWSF